MSRAKHLLGALGFAMAGLLLATSASADTMYSYFYVAGRGNYNVAPGGTVQVPLYLQEVNSDQSTNSLLGNEHGLTGAGINISYLFGWSGMTITGAAVNGGAVPNGFDDPASVGTVNSPTSATITGSTDAFPFGSDLVGVAAGPQINGVSQVLLGTVTVTAGLQPGQTTWFTLVSSDPVNGASFTNDSLYNLDNNGGDSSLYFSTASTSFSVTTSGEAVPVPLPPAIWGGLVMLGAMACRQWRHPARVR